MKNNTKHIVMFSGGKDSTAMLLEMIEKNIRIDEIVFVDTTKEFPEIYRNIEKVEKHIGMEVTKLIIKFDYWFKDHIKTKGKNKGKKGYGWMDFMNRWCTALKRDKTRKYLNNKYNKNEVTEFHGIAYNELHRITNNNERNIIYPLVELGSTEDDNLKYCYRNNFTWDGLYESLDRVSCYLCPLKTLREIKYIYQNYPQCWKDMKKLDEHSDRDFRPDYTLHELENKFNEDK
ncbi:MAG: phosphoadenosine phosphosulfate reductase family protein [Halanaerobiales bacterium]|nr:phosphoadenosine phosphosulfate reductase family protein [Halanaerobiales bacterium]